MRKVNIRKLRKDLAVELNELPFEVIRNGVVIATVVGDEIRKSTVTDIPTGFPVKARTRVEKVSELRENMSTFFRPMQKGGKK